MTRSCLMLSLCLVALPLFAPADAAPAPPAAGARKAPQTTGRTERGASAGSKTDQDAVVVPPVTDPEAVATPPKQIDPGMTAAPPDNTNREQSKKARK